MQDDLNYNKSDETHVPGKPVGPRAPLNRPGSLHSGVPTTPPQRVSLPRQTGTVQPQRRPTGAVPSQPSSQPAASAGEPAPATFDYRGTSSPPRAVEPPQSALSSPVRTASSVFDFAVRFAEELEAGADKVVMGQGRSVRLIAVALLVQGHVLLEGNPGTAKTLLVRTLSRLCSLEFRRIQFTPDLMPSDITGTSIFRPDRADFEFRRGPVFTQLLLADEINRAPARTQAALLQAMQERIVSADGTDHPLGDIFCVVATQNPLESEGTYPLPEAELDRFLFKLNVDYPDEATELEVFRTHGAPTGQGEFSNVSGGPLFDTEQLRRLRDAVLTVELRPEIARYALQIVRATREHPFLRAGASTRAGVMLLRASRALAATYGREFVVPDDVRELAGPCLRHRIYRTAAAELEGVVTDTIVEDIVSRIPVPR